MNRRVAVAISEGVPIFEAAIPCEVFKPRDPRLADDWYELEICAARPGHTRTAEGFVTGATRGLDGLRDADIVIVPACANVHDVQPPELVDAVRTAHAAGAKIVSICSGAFVLAAAGLLDDRQATLHWLDADLMAERHPAVAVDHGVLYIDHGDVLTSAGAAAGLDACLHVVRQHHGVAIANRLARRLIIPAHRTGGQAQFVEQPVTRDADRGLAPLLDWIVQHLDEPLTITALAERHAVAPRTLIRHFTAETGMPPLRWLMIQRVSRARALLESSRDPIPHIAAACGLGSEANFRRHFGRIVGVAPTDYRRAFCARRDDPTPAGQ